MRLLTAGLACAAVLTGCGGGSDSDEGSDSGPKKAAASSEPAKTPDLASGLLSDEAFGPDAVVAAVSPEDLEEGAGLAAQYGENVQITPESCVAAVEGTQPDLSDFEDVAAVSATVGTTATVQMLVRGGPIEGAVGDLDGVAERCPQAQISSPEFGTADVTFEDLPVSDMGDGAAAFRYTTVVSLPDGTQVSVPVLIGAVEDDDRLIILTTLSADPSGAATLDHAAFTALLAEAYETQAAAFD
jgi:hypothetical protein